jgi:hypothetical protein
MTWVMTMKEVVVTMIERVHTGLVDMVLGRKHAFQRQSYLCILQHIWRFEIELLTRRGMI